MECETLNPGDEGNPAFQRPMQLLKPSMDHSSLEPVPETIAALASVTSPVSVVTGVGSQRLGKSTLLNLFHSRVTAGFGLGHTLDAQTTGLWIWLRRHPRDPEVVICFMDTEGLDSPHISNSYNWILSSLALLISNTFLYQTKNSIDSSATERLNTILAVAEQLRGSDSTIMDDCTRPAFVWILRDMQLKMKLDPKSEMVSKLEDSHLRKMRKFFRAYDCVPLPRPVDSEEQLQQVETMAFSELKSAFLEEYFLLERQILNYATESNMIGKEKVTGSILSEMVNKYVKLIAGKSGMLNSIQSIPTCAMIISQMAGERAMKAATKSYEAAVLDLMASLPLPEEDVCARHEEILEFSRMTLRESAIGVEEEDLMVLVKLLELQASEWKDTLCYKGGCKEYSKNRTLIGGKLLALLESNRDANMRLCSCAWHEAFAPISEMVSSNAIQAVEEYDQAVRHAKSLVLEAAALGNRKKFMVDHLEDENTRITIERTRGEVQLFLARQNLIQQFQVGLSGLRHDTGSKMDALAQSTSLRYDALSGMVNSIRAENERDVCALGEEIKLSQTIAVNDMNEKIVNTRRELELQVEAQSTALETVIADLEAGQKLAKDMIESLRTENARDLVSLGSEIKDRYDVSTRSLEGGLAGLRLELDLQVQRFRGSLEASKADLLAARNVLEERVDGVRAECARDLTKFGVEIKNSQDTAVQKLKEQIDGTSRELEIEVEARQQAWIGNKKELMTALHETQKEIEGLRSESAEDVESLREEIKGIREVSLSTLSNNLTDLQRQIEQQDKVHQHDLEVTKADVLRGQEESRTLVNDLRSENAKLAASMENEFKENQMAMTLQSDENLSATRLQLELQIEAQHTALEETRAQLAQENNDVKEFVAAVQAKIVKEFASFGAEVHCAQATLQQSVDQKLKTSRQQQELEINALQSASETTRNELIASLQENKKAVEAMQGLWETKLKTLSDETQSVHAATVQDLGVAIESSRRKIELDVDDQKRDIQGVKAELARMQLDASESLVSLRSECTKQYASVESKMNGLVGGVVRDLEESLRATKDALELKLQAQDKDLESGNAETSALQTELRGLAKTLSAECSTMFSTLEAKIKGCQAASEQTCVQNIDSLRSQVEAYHHESAQAVEAAKRDLFEMQTRAGSAFNGELSQLNQNLNAVVVQHASTVAELLKDRQELGEVQLALKTLESSCGQAHEDLKVHLSTMETLSARVQAAQDTAEECRGYLAQVETTCVLHAQQHEQQKAAQQTSDGLVSSFSVQLERFSDLLRASESEIEKIKAESNNTNAVSLSYVEQRLDNFQKELDEQRQGLEGTRAVLEAQNLSASALGGDLSEISKRLSATHDEMLNDRQELGALLFQAKEDALQAQRICQEIRDEIKSLNLRVDSALDTAEASRGGLSLVEATCVRLATQREQQSTAQKETDGAIKAIMSEIEQIRALSGDWAVKFDDIGKQLVTRDNALDRTRAEILDIQERACSSLSTQISEANARMTGVEQQHSLCLRELLNDRQELGEVQLSLEQTQGEYTKAREDLEILSKDLQSLTGSVNGVQRTSEDFRVDLAHVEEACALLTNQYERCSSTQQTFEGRIGSISTQVDSLSNLLDKMRLAQNQEPLSNSTETDGNKCPGSPTELDGKLEILQREVIVKLEVQSKALETTKEYLLALQRTELSALNKKFDEMHNQNTSYLKAISNDQEDVGEVQIRLRESSGNAVSKHEATESEGRNPSIKISRDEVAEREDIFKYIDKEISSVRIDTAGLIAHAVDDALLRISSVVKEVESLSGVLDVLRAQSARDLASLGNEISGAHATTVLDLDERLNNTRRHLEMQLESQRKALDAAKSELFALHRSNVSIETQLGANGLPTDGSSAALASDLYELKSELKQDMYWCKRDIDAGMQDFRGRLLVLESQLLSCTSPPESANSVPNRKRTIGNNAEPSDSPEGSYKRISPETTAFEPQAVLEPFSGSIGPQAAEATMVTAGPHESAPVAPTNMAAPASSRTPSFAIPGSHGGSAWPSCNGGTGGWRANGAEDGGMLGLQVLRLGRNLEALFQAVWNMQETLQVLADRAEEEARL